MSTEKQNKWNHKRLAALIGLGLLGLVYIAFFIVAIFAGELPKEYFTVCLAATVFIPILIWVYIWLYGFLTNRHTIASMDILQTGKYAGNRMNAEAEEVPSATDESTDSVPSKEQ